MKRFLIPIISLFCLISKVQAQEVAVDFDSLLNQIKNPFEVKLPVIEVKEEKILDSSQQNMPDFYGQINNKVQNVTKNVIAPKVIEKPALSIQGVVWQTDRPLVIIDGKVLSISDQIAGAVIKDIFRSGMEVEYQGARFTYLIE